MSTLSIWTIARRRYAVWAAAALALAAGLAIAGFTALGSIFNYPQILHEPVDVILAHFRDHQVAVMTWFGVLVIGAGLMGPAAVWIGRLVSGRLGLMITVVGLAAATVQVVGLQRWITLVPALSRDALDPATHAEAAGSFLFWHHLLGTMIGETVGYALTAVFTVAVAVAFDGWVLPRWLVVVGCGSAILIATGVVIPLVAGASLTNFAGYVLWCGWLVVVAALLLRARRAGRVRTPAVTIAQVS